MTDGIIKLGTDDAKELGLTDDKFGFGTYLWRTGNRITISFIACKVEGRGYLRELFKTIIAKGHEIAVPTPSGRMRQICMKNGFIETTAPFADDPDELVEILLRPADS